MWQWEIPKNKGLVRWENNLSIGDFPASHGTDERR
jgi:hypothetical protein